MNKTLKTLGISLILATTLAYANTALADSTDGLDLACVSSGSGPVSIKWKAQDKEQISSYKIYISDPLSQAECYYPDLKLNYLEDSSKLNPANTEYAVNNLEKGKFYVFKLEAYKDDKLVRSDSVVSLIHDKGYGADYGDSNLFGSYMIDQNTVKIEWTNVFTDNVKRTMKFYNVDDKGLTEIGTADYAAGSYTFGKLEANKKYYVAGEVLSGDNTEFTCQFGFTTDYTAPQKTYDKKVKELSVDADGGTVYVEEEINISEDKDTGIVSSEIVNVDPSKADYKFFVSDPLSSKDYYANKDFSNFKQCLLFDHYVACDEETGFDQTEIYNLIRSGKNFNPDTDDQDDISGFKVPALSDRDPEMYYSVKVEAYRNGKLIAYGIDTGTGTPLANRLERFFGDFVAAEAKTTDGKTVNITWKDLAEYDDLPEGKRTVYFYLSSPFKDENKVYGDKVSRISAKLIGKTDYSKLKYKIKDLTPGRHYLLYMEVHYNGLIEDNSSLDFSTTVRCPELTLKQIKTNAVKINANESEEYYNRRYQVYDYYANCIKPEGIEYYKKDRDGKFKKFATAPLNKSVTDDNNVSLGKSCTYKARAYVTLNGKKYYSAFSTNKFTIKIENPKPVYKVSFVDKKKNIVKITSDKNNAVSIIELYYDIIDLRHSSDGKKFKDGIIKIKPGETMYLKLLNKKKAEIRISYESDWHAKSFDLTLNFNRSTYKLAKAKY